MGLQSKFDKPKTLKPSSITIDFSKLNQVKVSYKNSIGSGTSTMSKKVNQETLNIIHEKSALVKVTQSFYEGKGMPRSGSLENEMLEEIPADDNESEKSEKKEQRRFNSVQPIREVRTIGPLKIEKKYTGNN